MAGWIDRLTPLEAGAVVFDLGCGCGAMVEALRARLGGGGRYVGFDVHGPSIAWCRDHLANANTTFELARVDSPYADPPQPAAPPGPFPLPERAADFVLAKSVFTHLLERDTRHNLAEIARVLKPEGRALVSVFLFEPETETPVFKWQAPGSPARFRFKERPEAAVAWPRATFFSWIEAGRP
jgi:ubiquinone/menaquinone biosynthesis C-methylase UbiE